TPATTFLEIPVESSQHRSYAVQASQQYLHSILLRPLIASMTCVGYLQPLAASYMDGHAFESSAIDGSTLDPWPHENFLTRGAAQNRRRFPHQKQALLQEHRPRPHDNTSRNQ